MQFGKFFSAVAVLVGLLFFALPAVGGPPLSRHVPDAVTRLHLAPLGRMPGTNRLQLAIGLPLRNPDALAALLRELYDPASPNYHHFLTPAQFSEKFGPAPADYQAVIAYAAAHHFEITATHPNRCLLDVRASVSDVESAFHLHLNRYQHPSQSRAFFAPDAEPAPDLTVPILHVSGLDDLVAPRPAHVIEAAANAYAAPAPATGSGAGGTFLGQDFRAAYAPGVALTGNGQTVALVALAGFYSNDIAAYESLAGYTNVPVNPVLVDGYDGSAGASDFSLEISLDIEMAVAVAPGLDQVLVYEAPTTSPIDDVLNRIATDNAARQISASLVYEIDAATDQIFLQYAAQGQSFFNASGDGDAWLGPVTWSVCDDPNITLVGGTTLTTTGPRGAFVSETVWNWGKTGNYTFNPAGYVGSSGGISQSIPIPAWQQGIDMSLSQGSTSMRNMPDVALTADNIYVLYNNGTAITVGGTSAASPLWAGFTALVNQQAAAASRPPIGFINPAVYVLAESQNYAACFYDTTNGNNAWDQSPTKFFAVPGYDLCTGLGTPNGANLISALAVPDPLQIYPYAGFAAGSGPGGILSPDAQTLYLNNTGTNDLNWIASAPAAWLAVSPGGGVIPAGTNVPVNVSLTAAAYTLPPGTYTNFIRFTNLNDAFAIGYKYTLTILGAATIVTHPADQAVPLGAPAVFSTVATGGPPLTYQWYANGIPLTDNPRISGSATSSLTVSNVTVADTWRTYAVIVSNRVRAVDSRCAALSIVSAAPAIIRQPANFAAPQDGLAWFAVVPAGDTPVFQWSCNGLNLVAATNATLILSNVQPAQAGNYAVTLSNRHGTVTSSNATLTVLSGHAQVAMFDDIAYAASSPFIPYGYDSLNWSNFCALSSATLPNSGYAAGTVSPGNIAFNAWGSGAAIFQSNAFNLISACLTAAWNDGLQLEVKGYSGTRLLYDTTNTLSATQPTNITFNYFGVTRLEFRSFGGIHHSAYTSSGVQFAMDNMAFVAAGANSATSAPAIYHAGPTPLFLSQGQSATLAVAVTGLPPLSYQWYLNAIGIPGGTNAIFAFAPAEPGAGGAYTVSVVNSSGSATATVAAVTISDAVLPCLVNYPASQYIAPGGACSLCATVAGLAPLHYQWQFQGANLPGLTNNYVNLWNFSLANAGAYALIVTNSFDSVTGPVVYLSTSLAPGSLSPGAGQVLLYFPASGDNQGAPSAYQLQSSTSEYGTNDWANVTNSTALWTGLAITNGPADTAFFRFQCDPADTNPPPVICLGTWNRTPVILYPDDGYPAYSLLTSTDLVSGCWTPYPAAAPTFTGCLLGPAAGTNTIYYRLIFTTPSGP